MPLSETETGDAMSDREPLLAAILANPKDDLPRLVYADWLDEFGSGDLDAATSEFIRVSIGLTIQRQIHWLSLPAGYPFTGLPRWCKLLPKFVGNLTGYRVNQLRSEIAVESIIAPTAVKIRDKPTRYRDAVATLPVRLYFDRGFLMRYTCRSDIAKRKIEPALFADQPLCRLQHKTKTLEVES
jgi:uncharacterized protein (TIGR02996 family)